MKNKQQLDHLYKAYKTPLLAFFLSKRVERSRAEDFVQDVFLKYQRAGYQLDPIQSRVALFKIAKNVFFDHLRHTQTKRKLGVSEEQLVEIHPDLDAASETADPYRALESKQHLQQVLEKLQSLPPKCRDVFIDYRFRNLSQKEIARKRRISVSMVEKHVASAIQKLKSDGEA